jgi:hypothetical protein
VQGIELYAAPRFSLSQPWPRSPESQSEGVARTTRPTALVFNIPAHLRQSWWEESELWMQTKGVSDDNPFLQKLRSYWTFKDFLVPDGLIFRLIARDVGKAEYPLDDREGHACLLINVGDGETEISLSTSSQDAPSLRITVRLFPGEGLLFSEHLRLCLGDTHERKDLDLLVVAHKRRED